MNQITSTFDGDYIIDNNNNNIDTNDTLPSYIGYISVIGSSILFGSCYVPVKKFETGDGMFFQLMVCIGIWLAGFCLNAVRNFPKFYPLPMLGGFFWATGQVTVVPIIKLIGKNNFGSSDHQ
jgi:glucose uptake protein GlcU